MVEDEINLALVIIRSLEKNHDQVCHACDDVIALRLCEQVQPDLILLDGGNNAPRFRDFRVL